MSMAYLEDFVELVDQLPHDIKHNLSQIRSLDLKVQNTVDAIDKKKRRMFSQASKGNEPSQKDIDEIKKEYKKAIAASEDKLNLSSSTCEVLERVLRYLQAQISEFTETMENSTPGITRKLEEKSLALDAQAAAHDVPMDITADDYLGTTTPPAPSSSSRRKKKAAAQLEAADAAPLIQAAIPQPTGEPGEELWCYCRNVSYGEMIGCDGEDCAIEWFHYPCVGLTKEPVGKWYCNECRQKLKKKRAD